MISSIFSSLSPAQQDQVASMFLDKYFGILPEDYVYELDATTGKVTGRTPLMIAAVRSTKKIEDYHIQSTTILTLPDDAVRYFAELIFEEIHSAVRVDASPIHRLAYR
jgi:hypothetical protein